MDQQTMYAVGIGGVLAVLYRLGYLTKLLDLLKPGGPPVAPQPAPVPVPGPAPAPSPAPDLAALLAQMLPLVMELLSALRVQRAESWRVIRPDDPQGPA